ncbi:MAG: N-acetylmuramoyl-L-alanine amidase [Sedimentisphaerales bacterium]|nr:N-acetylmuramoyl-L-alanine amidase [Sedimentisphaerales bacterium]
MPANNRTKDGYHYASLRVWKALLMLLLSMTLGAAVLMALGNNPPSGGAFCLSSYYMLAATDKLINSSAAQTIGRWSSIEICYSGTSSGNCESLAKAIGLRSHDQLPYHFVVCNGHGGSDGQILPTVSWDRQLFIGDRVGRPRVGTIRICIVADGRNAYPTDAQVKRVDCLVDSLCKRFQILPSRVYYPSDLPGAGVY